MQSNNSFQARPSVRLRLPPVGLNSNVSAQTMHLRLSKSQEDPDGLHQFWLSAASGGHSTSIDFYAYPDDLAEFGNKLSSFTGGAGDEPFFECGSTEERAYSWVRLQAFPIDSLGHSVLQVATNRNGARHVRASVCFSAQMEVAGINQLGYQLAKWAMSAAEELEFRDSER